MKKSTIVKMLILIILSFSFIAIFAGCAPSDKNGFQYSYSKGAKGYTFFVGVGFNVEMTEVVIPSTFRGKPVVSISEGFRNNYGLNGDGWRTGQTDKILSVTIPSSIKTISAGAFQDCAALTKIIISNDNTIYKSDGNCVIEIGTNRLIAACNDSVVPGYVTSFSAGAVNNTNIINDAPDNSIVYVNKWAVGYKGSPDNKPLLKNDTIGIADGAFSNWLELESIILPSSITSIGDYAFNNCRAFTSIFIPKSVELIGYSAFRNCLSLVIYAEAESGYFLDTEHIVIWGAAIEDMLDN